jgi:predicted permease
MLRPLPYPDPASLVWIWDTQPQIKEGPCSLADVLDWKDQSRSFESIAAFQGGNIFFGDGDQTEDLRCGVVDPDLFGLMKVSPALGRQFLSEDTEQGRNRVVILSDQLWRRSFGSDPGIVGRTVAVSGNPWTVVGVMPAGFDFPPRAELWIPLVIKRSESARAPHYLSAVGRLKHDVTFQQAAAEMSAIAARLSEEHRDVNAGHGVKLVSLHDLTVGDSKLILLVLFAAVGFVLLIACGNVANLLLARAQSRRREIAVRRAIGAARIRIVRQLLTESVLLALIGGGVGLILAVFGVRILLSLGPDAIPRSREITLDRWVVAFTACVSLATGTLFGLAPALEASRTDINNSLKDRGRPGQGAGPGRLSRVLVVSEIALALVLQIGAGLMINSMAHLGRVKPGFDPQGLLTMNVTLLPARYRQEPQVESMYRQIIDRGATIPGVRSIAGISNLPLGGGGTSDYFEIEGRPHPAQENRPITQYWLVTPNYFRVMGIPIKDGQDFTWNDTRRAPNVAIINETFARAYWPNSTPIGSRLTLQGQQRDALMIIGVVGDVRDSALNLEPTPQTYVPYLQDPLGEEMARSMTLVAKCAADPQGMAFAIQDGVKNLDKTLPLSQIKTMSDYMYESIGQQRFNMVLLAVFAAFALMLAVFGVYGVTSYLVAQRTREIGLRMALGARPADALGLLLKQNLLLVSIGIGIGVAGALAVTRVLSDMLYGVSTTDLATFVILSLLLGASAMLATYLPARRAAGIDPMTALRWE